MRKEAHGNYASDFFEWDKKIDGLKAQVKSLRLTPFNWHIQYLDEAVKCFHQYLSISCIIVSSTLVEVSLCWEKFRFRQNPKKIVTDEEFRRNNLNNLFDFFLDKVTPLEFLMDSDENIASLRKMEKKERIEQIRNIRYIRTRNKFVHGDLFYQAINLQSLLPTDKKELQEYNIKDWKLGGTLELRTVAYVHLFKTLRFMDAFTNWVNHEEEKGNRLRKNHLYGVG